MKFRASTDISSFEFQLHQNGNITVLATDDEEVTIEVSQISPNCYSILCEGKSYLVTVEDDSDNYRVAINQFVYNIRLSDETKIMMEEVGAGRDIVDHSSELHAPIPGLASSILVSKGDSVSKGQRLMIIDAMKMENEITSPVSGIISDIFVELGSTVDKGELLLIIRRNK